MAWFSRITRFGDLHWVFGQENTIACGIACAVMAAFKINKFTPGVRATFDESDVLKQATALLGPNPLGTDGLDNPSLVKVLNDSTLNMPGWRVNTVAKNTVVSELISSVGVTEGLGPTLWCKPIIVGIDWNGGGGHWVVVDTVRKFMGDVYATVCDPWDANVHIVKLNLKSGVFGYTGQAAPHLDFWGTHHGYQAPSVGGCFVGDLIERS